MPSVVLEISLSPFDKTDIDVVKNISSFYDVDQSTLRKLVKEKNIEKLDEFNGVQGIATSLNSNVYHGINGDDADDISRRIEAFGSNIYPKPPSKGTFFHFVWEAFKDPTIAILLASAMLSLGFGIKKHGPREGWYDGGSIFVAVFLVISVSAISNFWQSRQSDDLSEVSNNIQIQVVRNGRQQQISICKIVVGDVVYLKKGDRVPADGLFLDGHSLRIDESSMTGETDQVEINHNQNPFLISGTKVANGYGQMLVTSVGMNTTWGEMMSSVSCDINDKTPLQERLNKLTSAIGKFCLAVSFLVHIVLLVRYFTGNTSNENGNIKFGGGKTMVTALLESLPLAGTLALSYSLHRMMTDNAIVQKHSGCENMGSATTICTHKTGTLTQNKMTVREFWLGKELIQTTNYTSIVSDILKLLHQAVSLNTTGSISKTANSQSKDLDFSGSPIEEAILSWAVIELTMDMEQVKQSCTILHVEAFDSDKKRSGVLIEKNMDKTVHVHWKGAAEMILAMCSHYYNPDGEVIALDDNNRKHFNEMIIQDAAASGLRCIAFAHKQITGANHDDGETKQQLPENGLILLGIVGIRDPCRPGVKKAVEDCQQAGVNVKMITGDNIFTAAAIANECGILTSNHNNGSVVEAAEFRNYTDDERMEKIDKIVVMARSSPSNKNLMVKCLKQKGHVVAVTGDGESDARALKEADIGLSMGNQGNEVEKKSSWNIVIKDDNFASVAAALGWGRCVYNNIQTFIQFQLTVIVAALVINFVAAVSARELPLTAVQLLWVNLIMDTLGALALATERPTEELMKKPPVGRSEPLVTNIMWRNLLTQALYQIVVLLTLQFKGESIFHVSKKVNDTLIFNTFVLCQVFNEFNARKLEKKNVFEGIHKNKWFLGSIGITIILQVIMVEFLKRFANTERLNWGQWGACTGIAAASLPIGWLIKCIPVPEKPFFSYLKWINFVFEMDGETDLMLNV